MLFLLYWLPIIIGILSFLFCRFCLSKYNWDEHKEIQYKIKLWVFLLYLIWCLIPLFNWACAVIILHAIIEGHYSIKESIVDWFKSNSFINFLNKEI